MSEKVEITSLRFEVSTYVTYGPYRKAKIILFDGSRVVEELDLYGWHFLKRRIRYHKRKMLERYNLEKSESGPAYRRNV